MDQNNPEPDYSFLENNEKSGYFDFYTKASKKTRTKILGIGGGTLLLLLIIISSFIFGGDDNLRNSLITVAQRQNEIIRITEIGEDKARSQEVLSISVVTKASMRSSQSRITGVLGGRLPSGVLRQLQSERTTNELNSAEQANRFDEVYVEVLETELTRYLASLETAAAHASGNTLRLLDEVYREAELILKNLEEI